MNYQHLKYFISLVNEKNYQNTAEKNYISQPALTKAMKNLEKDCKCKLFIKNGRKNELTEEGQYFYQEIKKAVSIIDNCINNLNDEKSKREEISVGAIYSCATTCAPLSFSLFNSRYKKANFSLLQLNSKQIISELRNRKLDIGLVSYIPDDFYDDAFSTMFLFNHKVLAAIPSENPLSKKSNIKYDDIVSEPFIYYTKSCGNFRALENKIKSQNLKYPDNIVVRCDSEDTVISSVRNNLGVGLVSDTEFNRNLNLCLKKISDVDLTFPVYLIWNKEKLSSDTYSNYANYILMSHSKSMF